jgi:hypothetical protein
MKKHLVRFAAFVLMSGGFCAHAGELSYVPIPASQSDANSGISNANQYTTALDAGSEANRALNGVTLYGSPGSGPNIVASNCSVTASSGSLITTGGAIESIQADGTLREVLSDVIYNSGAEDNSRQEIVLNPASLTPGATYDLRIYVGKGGNGDRQVNLAFVGDGQAPTETGFFNEDDARSSAGGFQDPSQVYVINYRFTWDGNSAPGITVTQKSGQAPFVLYALTNHPVAAPPSAAAAPQPQPPADGQAINAGLVTAEADQVGVTSDTFYSNESLNTKGRWIGVKKYGRCWQPNDYPSDWRPYTRGNWKHCEDCGWTWVSDASEEEWGWATYHYGRWVRVGGVGCGWAWVPGTVWGPGWVSWRKGETPDCTCVGWAPLPPEAPCEVGVGVSRWVDRTCDIGPDNYTFVHVRDFGSNNYRDCGCVLERKRYVNIVEHTVNITNISYVNVNVNINVGRSLHVNVYNGGPDFNWCNTEIRRHGGQEMVQVHINRYDDPGMFKNKKFSHQDGDMLNLFTPKVFAQKQTKFTPKVFVNVADSKIDHGWNEIKDKKIKTDLRTKIADQTKGLTPETTKAELPKDVAEKITKDQLAKGSPSPAATSSPVVVTGQKTFFPTPNATVATGAGGVDWKATVKGDGKDKMPSDPKALASLQAYAAENKVSPETYFDMYTKQAAAKKAAEDAAKNPNDAQAAAAVTTAKAEQMKAFDAFDAEAKTNILKAGRPSLSASPGTTTSPAQTATISPAAKGTVTPSQSLTAAQSPTATNIPTAPKGLGVQGQTTVTASPSVTASPATSASPTRTFPETYKAPLTLKPVSPTAAASASPRRTFPETYKAPLTLKPVSPTASPSATAAGNASPTRTFPETYKAPLTLKSVTPAPSVTPSASPTRTFPETYKAPLTLKPLSPTALPSATAAGSASPTHSFPETFHQTTPLPSASPRVIRSVAPTSSPAPTIGKAWTYTPTPQPTIKSTPKPTPQTPTPVATQTPKPIKTPPSREKDQVTPPPTPRATITPKIKIQTPTPPQIDKQKLLNDAAAAKAQQLNQQKLQQQQLMQQKQAQDAAAVKANAAAAAKAKSQQTIAKPKPTPTPTPAGSLPQR